MSSPFSSFQEFSEAEGPIYTFANNPTMIGFLLVICLAITLYFFYAAYTIKQNNRPDHSVRAIGLLLVAGAASLFSLLTPSPKPQVSDRPQPQRSTTAKTTAQTGLPALLGMVGLGRSTLARKPRRKLRR